MVIGRSRRPDRFLVGHDQQRGIALLTALFVVALVSVAAAAVYASQSLALKRAANQLDGEQAWDYALGLEELARNVLAFDTKLSPDADWLDDIWARQDVVFPVQNGTLSGRIVDLQGAFNLNNLSLPDTDRARATAFGKMVEAVNQQFNVPAVSRNGQRRGTGPEVADAIHDWVDPDDEPTGTSGVENSGYLSELPALRTAGRPLIDVSEIRNIRGITPELYLALTHCGPRGESFISALPLPRTSDGTRFQPSTTNVNTAPLLVLQALPGVDPNLAKQFDSIRKGKPLKNTADIPKTLYTTGYSAPQNPPLPLNVKSSWFRLEAVSAVGGTQVAMYSTLFRPTAGVPPSIYYRSTAPG